MQLFSLFFIIKIVKLLIVELIGAEGSEEEENGSEQGFPIPLGLMLPLGEEKLLKASAVSVEKVQDSVWSGDSISLGNQVETWDC